MKIVWLFVGALLCSIFLVGLGYQIGNYSTYQKPIMSNQNMALEICDSNLSSPIDIYPALLIKSEVQDPKFQIPVQSYSITKNQSETYLFPTKDSYLSWNSTLFILQKITFYSSSKHKINSNSLGLEINLEFKESTSKNQKQIINIAKLFRFGGKNDKFQKLINQQEKDMVSPVDFGSVLGGKFAVYQGSEISKNCTKPATWIVYTDLEEIAPDQAKFFAPNLNSVDSEINNTPRLIIGK
jgi:carbonic anhydrase